MPRLSPLLPPLLILLLAMAPLAPLAAEPDTPLTPGDVQLRLVRRGGSVFRGSGRSQGGRPGDRGLLLHRLVRLLPAARAGAAGAGHGRGLPQVPDQGPDQSGGRQERALHCGALRGERLPRVLHPLGGGQGADEDLADEARGERVAAEDAGRVRGVVAAGGGPGVGQPGIERAALGRLEAERGGYGPIQPRSGASVGDDGLEPPTGEIAQPAAVPEDRLFAPWSGRDQADLGADLVLDQRDVVARGLG